jgi:predicted nucleic acid-binding protein
VTAEQAYVDSSALGMLYLHQPRSRDMAAWRGRIGGSLPVTHFGRTEIVNAIGLGVHRGSVAEDQAARLWERLDADFVDGHLTQVDILWRAAVNRAAKLSQRYTPKLGTRSLDVLHVACALELKLPHFLTFDLRQQALAKAVGLKLVKL